MNDGFIGDTKNQWIFNTIKNSLKLIRNNLDRASNKWFITQYETYEYLFIFLATVADKISRLKIDLLARSC